VVVVVVVSGGSSCSIGGGGGSGNDVVVIGVFVLRHEGIDQGKVLTISSSIFPNK